MDKGYKDNFDIIDISNLQTKDVSFDSEEFLIIKNVKKSKVVSCHRISVNSIKYNLNIVIYIKNGFLKFYLFLYDLTNKLSFIKKRKFFINKDDINSYNINQGVCFNNKNVFINLVYLQKVYSLDVVFKNNKKENFVVKLKMKMLNKVSYDYFLPLKKKTWLKCYEQFNLDVNGYIINNDKTYYFNENSFANYILNSGFIPNNFKYVNFSFSGLVESNLISFNFNNYYDKDNVIDNIISINNNIYNFKNSKMIYNLKDNTIKVESNKSDLSIVFNIEKIISLSHSFLKANRKIIIGKFNLVFKLPNKIISLKNVFSSIYVKC